jgi:hypothetical protein
MTPFVVAETAKALYKTKYTGDRELKLNGSLRLIQSPFTLAGAAGSGATTVFTIGKLFDLFTVGRNVVTTLTKLSVIAGFIICGFETVYEVLGFKRAVSFLAKLEGINSPRKFFEWLLNREKTSPLHPHGSTSIAQFAEKLAADPLQAKALYEDRRQQLIDIFESLNDKAKILAGDIPSHIPQDYVGSNGALDVFEQRLQTARYASILESISRRYLTLSAEKCAEIKNRAEQHFMLQERFSTTALLVKASDVLPQHIYREIKDSTTSTYELKAKFQEAYEAFLIEEKIQGKRNNLAERVRIWKAQEVVDELPSILKQLNNRDPAAQSAGREAAQKLLDDLKTQGTKKVLGHTISLAAIVFTLIGLALFVACPYASVAFVGVGMIVGLSRYVFNTGIADTQGWNFKPDQCVPDFVKKHWTSLINRTEAKEQGFVTTPMPMPVFF